MKAKQQSLAIQDNCNRLFVLLGSLIAVINNFSTQYNFVYLTNTDFDKCLMLVCIHFQTTDHSEKF